MVTGENDDSIETENLFSNKKITSGVSFIRRPSNLDGRTLTLPMTSPPFIRQLQSVTSGHHQRIRAIISSSKRRRPTTHWSSTDNRSHLSLKMGGTLAIASHPLWSALQRSRNCNRRRSSTSPSSNTVNASNIGIKFG